MKQIFLDGLPIADQVESLLAQLTPFKRKVVSLHSGLNGQPMPRIEIGMVLGKSMSAVKFAEGNTLRDLRKLLGLIK